MYITFYVSRILAYIDFRLLLKPGYTKKELVKVFDYSKWLILFFHMVPPSSQKLQSHL